MIIEATDFKQFSRCKKWLKRSNFHKQSDPQDHLQWHCKKCDMERRYEHRSKNLEHELERQRLATSPTPSMGRVWEPSSYGLSASMPSSWFCSRSSTSEPIGRRRSEVLAKPYAEPYPPPARSRHGLCRVASSGGRAFLPQSPLDPVWCSFSERRLFPCPLSVDCLCEWVNGDPRE
jgi:hypothetical protein